MPDSPRRDKDPGSSRYGFACKRMGGSRGISRCLIVNTPTFWCPGENYGGRRDALLFEIAKRARGQKYPIFKCSNAVVTYEPDKNGIRKDALLFLMLPSPKYIPFFEVERCSCSMGT